MKKEIIWITWENQRRNREIAKSLDVPLFEIPEIDLIDNSLRKYFTGVSKTIKILLDQRPKLVFCQNPSIVLAYFLVLIKHIFGMKIFVDAHNAGIFPKEGHSAILTRIAHFIQRNADVTIVTNSALKEHVERNGGKSFILPDKIPSLHKKKICLLKGKFNFLFICTFAIDEPYDEVFKAAREIDSNICIYVSGNFNKKNINPKIMPKNVILKGFMSEEEYVDILHSVDATIVLSKRENCLLCGAYETLAVEKPMILSNKEALRNYFNMGVIYSENTSESLKTAISLIIEQRDELTSQIRKLKVDRMAEWELKKKELQVMLLKI